MKNFALIIFSSISTCGGSPAMGQIKMNDSIIPCNSKINLIEGQLVYNSDVDFLAEYSGGEDELLYFISKNIRISKASLGITKILVNFIIDSKGKVRNPCIIQRKGEPLLSEADYNLIIKCFISMPRWRPARLNNREVNSILSLPIFISIDD